MITKSNDVAAKEAIGVPRKSIITLGYIYYQLSSY